MDALALHKPSLNPFHSQTKPTHFSFFKPKTRTFHVCFSYKPPSSPGPQPTPKRPPLCPLPILLPVLRHITKWVSFSHFQSQPGETVLKQNGSLGFALLSVTYNAKVRISPFIATLAANPTFVSGLFAWFFAQSTKVCLNFFVEKKWNLRILFASGGMPSSHSALCTALTTSVALCHGVADSLFPVCLGFSLIVMYDAIGVRRHAGMQAKVLNMIVEDLFQGHPISQRKLKELLGHTPSQVLAGAVLGILIACYCCTGCSVVT